AGQSNRLFTDAMQGMEDALVTFATTGKLNFRNLANAIIADIARVQAKALVSKLFGQGGGGGSGLVEGIKGFFGGGSSFGVGAAYMNGPFLHAGGIAGD